MQCPECGSPIFMRAIRLVEFHVRSSLWASIFGPVKEIPIGYNAVCANPGCSTLVRVDGKGMRRLKTAQPQGSTDEIPPAPEKPRPQMHLHRTPGLQWTRTGR